MAENDNWVALLKLSTVEMDEVEAVEVNGLKLAVFHLEDGSVHVTRNVCTHEFALLSEGWFEGCEIECPLHAGRFDVRTGEALCSPPNGKPQNLCCQGRGWRCFRQAPD